MTAPRAAVLQLVGGTLDRGGIIAWLRAVEPRARDRFPIRFIYGVGPDGAAGICELTQVDGCAAVALPSPARPRAFAERFEEFLLRHPEISVVHSHLHHWAGVALRASARAGVPIRVAHSHNSWDPTLYRIPKPLRLPFRVVSRRWVSRFATDGLGVSGEACVGLFGARWRDDRRWGILHCGISLDCREIARRESVARHVRTAWGIAEDTAVVAVIGRFAPAKNHAFAVRVAAELMQREGSAWHVVFVGDGELRRTIEAEIASYRLEDRITITGWHRDVLGLLRSAIDVVLAPSFHEGLPLTLLEAQFAGVPVVASDRITSEAIVVEELCQWLSLDLPVPAWADAIEHARAGGRRSLQLAAFRGSSFDSQTAADSLGAFYLSRLEAVRR